MKKLLTVIIAVINLIACSSSTNSETGSLSSSQSTEFHVTVDTINLSVNGDLRSVVLFRDNFYGLFESRRNSTTEGFKKMIVFNKKEGFVEDVFLPEGIQNMSNYDLIVANDSFYFKERDFGIANFVLGEYVADFKLCKTKDFPIYTDEHYRVYATCNGEFGGTVYFHNIQTKKSYEAESTCPVIVNKIDTVYYVTNYLAHMLGSASVIKIANPENLEKSDLNFNTHQGSLFKKGTELLLDSAGFYIASSFVYNNQLMHLYSSNEGSYIGEIVNNKMKPVFQFNFKFSASFNQQLNNGKQVLSCWFEDDKCGVLVIEKNNFHFYKLK